MNKKLLLLGLWTFALMACYSPDPFQAESMDDGKQKNESSDIGKIFSVNGSNQVCNPSISQDTVNFPASMLWLNFQSDLKVKSPDTTVYTIAKAKVKQHDRLTVSDTAGVVKWYLMRDLSKGECQFQDPEWSTHPDYIVSLRGQNFDGGKGCPDVLDYGIFAVRTADKAKFWFFDKGIIETATPHLWVNPAAKFDKDGDISTVEGFFGTNDVRLTYVDGDNNSSQHIVFIDFANGGKAKAVKLKKPKDRLDWGVESPMISPDGNFVVYAMENNASTWESYIQELSEDAEPIKIERTKDMVSDPSQPHWFEFGGRLFVIWAEFKSTGYYNTVDLKESSAQDGSVGRTVMREIRLTAGAPKDIFMEWVGGNIELAPIPMIGGRTPDGKFLATGYKYAYLLKLP